MKAFLSGQAGLAIIRSPVGIRVFSNARPESPVDFKTTDIHFRFENVSGMREFDVDSEDALVEELELRWSSDRALRLSLISLDHEEPDGIRSEAVSCLQDLFLSPDVTDYVANRLYSAPMPDAGDLQRTIELCGPNTVTGQFFCDLLNEQGEIRRWWRAWEDLPINLFGSMQGKLEFHADAIREGAFRLFVTGRDKGDWALFQMLSHPSFRGVARARSVFQAWYAPFKTSYTPLRSAFVEEEKDSTISQHSAERSVSSHQMFKQAERQRDAIKKLLAEGRVEQALRFTDELVSNQRRNSDPEHIAKSLCDLSQFVKERGSPDLQRRFAEMATREAPDDAWAYATLGDAYRGLGDYPKALDAFQSSTVLGGRHVGNLGRAEVLKDLGQIEEALRVLDFCASTFPENQVVANSRASALSDFGRFDEALTAYDKILEESISYDSVTLTGRAQVLRNQGRLDEARSALESVAMAFPEEFVPRYTHAEVIRELGDLVATEAEMRALSDGFPDQVIALCGWARALRDLGQFEEAMKAYEDAIRLHPLSVAGNLGKGDTHRKLGHLDEARNIYSSCMENWPRVGHARTGLASILIAQSNYDEALLLLSDKPPATKGEWVAFHIRGMAFLRSLDFEKANEILEWGAKECPWLEHLEYFATALASCRIRQGRYREAVDLVRPVSSLTISSASHTILMHACGELGDQRSFDQARTAIPNTASPVELRLRDDLVHRYRGSGGVEVGVNQIFTAECDLLLLAA